MTERCICSDPYQNKIFHFCRSYRYAAYRVTAWFLFGRLGRQQRRRLPDCLGKNWWKCNNGRQITCYFVVQYIRAQYPDPRGDYTGFIDVNAQEKA